MTGMQAYWILPNREQRDDVQASDGKTILPLKEVLDPKTRPPGFSHGVPAELLEECEPDQTGEILFAQKFPEWDGGKQLFSVSTPAGADASGRVVYLGLLFILEAAENPKFDVPYAGLPHAEQSYARALLERLASPRLDDLWACSVHELIEVPSRKGAATNIALQRSVIPFYSLYAADNCTLMGRLASRSRSRVPALALVILLAVVGGWVWAHACGGAQLWRFN